MRRILSAVVISTLALSLTGCAAGFNAATRDISQVTDGAEASIISTENNIRVVNLLVAAAPKTECLKDDITRMLPYWDEAIVPDLKAGKRVLVTAHGNSLRALVKHLDGITDADIAGVNIPTGIPLYYKLDENFKPVVMGGEYLDPEAAKVAMAAVAAQGKK